MIPLHDDNPTHIRPIVTIFFIVSCILIFLWQISLGKAIQAAVYAFGMTPAVLFGAISLPPEVAILPPWMTVLSSMFLHGGWMHLLGNMLYLWIFGNNIEDAMGHGRFILFYVLCGIIAALAHALPSADSVIPMVGASGAISGVLGAYLVLYPRARVVVLIPLGFYMTRVLLPAGVVLIFWFLLQFLNSLVASGGAGGGVAWGAHIGGFIAGILLIPIFKYRHVKFFQSGTSRVRMR